MRIVLLALLAGFTALGQAQRYTVKPDNANRLELRVVKTGLYKGKVHVFLFAQYTMELTYDPAKPETSSVKLTIDSSSATCIDTWLSAKDLKSVQEYAWKDMLNVSKFPEIVFTSTNVKPLEGSRFDVAGNLTIGGLAKPSTVHVAVRSGPTGTLIVQGNSVIRLKDYRLDPPKAALGLIGTENEMPFSFDLALGQVKGTQANK